MSKYFTIQIKANKCNYQLRINDIIIYIETEGYNVDFELPINHYAISGLNNVSVKLLPIKNEKLISKLAAFSIVIYDRESNEKRDSRVEITNFKSPDFKPKEITPPVILLKELQFENPDPYFKNFRWQLNLQKLNREEHYNQAVSFYKYFHSLMVAKNIRAIMKLLESRMNHYSAAMYMNKEEFIELNKDFYDSMFLNENMIAWPLEKQKLILIENYDSKLFTIKNEIQESPLIFYDTKEKESHYIDFFIGRVGNEKEFSIIL